jgi:hypothetical protein
VALGAQALAALALLIFRNIRNGMSAIDSQPMVAWVCLALLLVIPVQRFRSIFMQDGPFYWDRWNAAQAVDGFANDQTKLIVVGEYTKHVGGYDLSPVLYYYAGLQGWSLTPADWNMNKVDSLIKKGATLFVLVPSFDDPTAVNYQPEVSSDTFINNVMAKYPVLYSDQGTVIIDLLHPK